VLQPQQAVLPQNFGDRTAHQLRVTDPAAWLAVASGEDYSFLQSVVTRLEGHTDSTVCATFEADLRVCATDMDAYMKAHLLVPFGMTNGENGWKLTHQLITADQMHRLLFA